MTDIASIGFAIGAVAFVISILLIVESMRVYRYYENPKTKFYSAYIGAAAMFGFNVSVSLMAFKYHHVIFLRAVESPSEPPLVYDVMAYLSVFTAPASFAAPVLWLLFVIYHTDLISDSKYRWIIRILLLYIVIFMIGISNWLDAWGIINLSQKLLSTVNAVRAILLITVAVGAVGYGTVKLFASSKRHATSNVRSVSILATPPILIVISQNLTSIQSLNAVSTMPIISLLFIIEGIIIFSGTKNSNLLEDTPATTSVGRKTTIEAIENAVFITDLQGLVTDANSSAIELFGEKTSPMNERIDTLFPTLDDERSILEMDQQEITVLDDNTIFFIEVNNIDDGRGRNLGYIVNLQDVTGIKRNQQRISVLSRVLRHNLRNDLNAASGFAELAASDGDLESQQYLNRLQEQLDGLVEKSEKARNIEQLIDQSPRSKERHELGRIVEQTVQGQDYPEKASVGFTKSEGTRWTNTNPIVLSSVIEECVQNSIDHNQEGVNIQITVSDEGQIMISDDGVGIPEHELVVLDSDEETDLEHGSGLGLWLIMWGMDHIGGSVDIDTSGSGTTVTLLPPSTASS